MSAEIHDDSHTRTCTAFGNVFCVNCMFLLHSEMGFSAIEVAELEEALNMQCWEFGLSPRMVLDNPSLSETHAQRIVEARPELWPIFVVKQSVLYDVCGVSVEKEDVWEVLDGMHRIARCVQTEQKYVFANIVNKDVLLQTLY